VFGEISVLPSVKDYIGKVVWVLDDVTTTNFTLRAAVQSLQALEIHSHGLAYVLMA
jgi:predicted amidophosphoribosyltransferase